MRPQRFLTIKKCGAVDGKPQLLLAAYFFQFVNILVASLWKSESRSDFFSSILYRLGKFSHLNCSRSEVPFKLMASF